MQILQCQTLNRNNLKLSSLQQTKTLPNIQKPKLCWRNIEKNYSPQRTQTNKDIISQQLSLETTPVPHASVERFSGKGLVQGVEGHVPVDESVDNE